ncbi:sodium/calcium exchanger Calx-like [Babylonia areolata]|uniref:sodium/calcium exchanger Calx-like n=1 Tax=Babylonia areolata TaxID=304850 RepID=UPI003FD2015C
MSNDTVCSARGLLLPVVPEEGWLTGLRGSLYLLGLLWCFFGVAIVSDCFMCSIETITSRTRKVQIPDPNSPDGVKTIHVKVWNDTVANLSLLAFGTSAPEMMMYLIEMVTKGFQSGELGPGTIVGSAAFNLFVITALCIVSVPKGEGRRLKNMRVFTVTSFMGVFAYAWVAVVLMGSSPKEVELWEAVVTLAFFPVMIVVAYVADKGLYCCASNKTASEVEVTFETTKTDLEGGTITGSADIIDVAREFQKETTLGEEETARILAAKLAEKRPKPSGWYRVSATRVLTGGHRLLPKVNTAFSDLFDKVRTKSNAESLRKLSVNTLDQVRFVDKAVIEFTSASCAVLENEGHVRLGIRRFGNMDKEVTVGIETIDGTATAQEDYRPVKTLLTFKPKESRQDFFVEIVDDDVWEPDEFFYVKLFLDPQGSKQEDVVIGKVCINQVTIVNDDEPGRLQFSKPSYLIKESSERAQLTVQRVSGADGQVAVSWRTVDLSARAGQEYVGGCGRLEFKHGETSKNINVGIIGIKATEHEPNFQVELSSPTGGAEIGKIPRAIVTLINDEEFSSVVSRIAAKTQHNLQDLQLDGSSWGQQFYAAMNVNGGDIDSATKLDYVLHFVTFFWKVLFAFIPPTSIMGGWATFFVSLVLIGVLTAIISDLASIFGCLVGLSDTITAITFVALGTSMPDTFASRTAALHERHADVAIGNINGSNAVNVFLGLGLPWFLAAIYWKIKGGKLTVTTESLGFNVTLFAALALCTVAILMARRHLSVFGKTELGGTTRPKWFSAILIAFFWILYILLSILKALGIIDVGF